MRQLILATRKQALSRLAVVGVLALATVGAAALALAANTKPSGAGKAPLFDSDPASCPNGAVNTLNEFGFVILNTNDSGDLIVEVSVKNGPPEQVFDIYVNQSNGSPAGPKCPTLPTGTLTTNRQGNGNAHLTEPRLPTATRFWVSADGTPTGGPILRSTAVTLD